MGRLPKAFHGPSIPSSCGSSRRVRFCAFSDRQSDFPTSLSRYNIAHISRGKSVVRAYTPLHFPPRCNPTMQ